MQLVKNDNYFKVNFNTPVIFEAKTGSLLANKA
jgi:hypothetical protein